MSMSLIALSFADDAFLLIGAIMKAKQTNQSKSIKQVVAESYKDSIESVTEVTTVAGRLVAKTPKIVSDHAKRVNAEMDAIFAELGL